MTDLHLAVTRAHYELAVAVNAANELTPEVARLVALKAIAFIEAENARNRQNVMDGPGDLAGASGAGPSRKRGNGAAP